MNKLTKSELEKKKAYHEKKVDLYSKKIEEIKPNVIGFKYKGMNIKD